MSIPTNEPENSIVFHDIEGYTHFIRIEHITKFGKAMFRYCIWFIKADGNYSYCYLDEDDPTNYVVYKGTKYTNRDFNKLTLAVQNENNLAAIEELG